VEIERFNFHLLPFRGGFVPASFSIQKTCLLRKNLYQIWLTVCKHLGRKNVHNIHERVYRKLLFLFDNPFHLIDEHLDFL
jgi:hypothetical protein